MFTAPHGIFHFRLGKKKAADANVTLLAKRWGHSADPNAEATDPFAPKKINKYDKGLSWAEATASASVSWVPHVRDEAARHGYEIVDPNFTPPGSVYKRGPFYRALKQLRDTHIGKHHQHKGFKNTKMLVMDIHGMSDEHPSDVALGLAAWEKVDGKGAALFRKCLLEELGAALSGVKPRHKLHEEGMEDFGGIVASPYKVGGLKYFTGDHSDRRNTRHKPATADFLTVSQQAVEKLRIPSVQIEYSRRLRVHLSVDRDLSRKVGHALKNCYRIKQAGKLAHFLRDKAKKAREHAHAKK